MNKRLVSFGLYIMTGTLLVGSPLLGEDLVRPGQWELVSTMTMAKKPGKPPETRQNHCYSAADVAGVNAKSAALMTNSSKMPANQKCTVTDVKYVGNQGTWKTVCPGGMTIHSNMTFHGDSLEGVIEMGSGDQMMTVHMSAKRIGDCK
jgi:hypothetical protein